MLIRAVTWLLLIVASVVPLSVGAHAADHPAGQPAPTTTPPTIVPTAPPPDTVNDFLPEDRGIGECISALPKPGCGSESRGGWAQTAVFGAMLAGLGIIGWRIVANSRRAKGSSS